MEARIASHSVNMLLNHCSGSCFRPSLQEFVVLSWIVQPMALSIFLTINILGTEPRCIKSIPTIRQFVFHRSRCCRHCHSCRYCRHWHSRRCRHRRCCRHRWRRRRLRCCCWCSFENAAWLKSPIPKQKRSWTYAIKLLSKCRWLSMTSSGYKQK